MIALLRPFIPHIIVGVICGAIGFSGAWEIQGLRITAAEQAFTQYKQEQVAAAQAAQAKADQQREETAREFRKLKDQLSAADAFRRCVAAGRCGMLHQPARAPGLKVPTPGGIDGPRADPIPAPAGTAEEVAPPVVTDCAVTTLMLNQLQADIERQ